MHQYKYFTLYILLLTTMIYSILAACKAGLNKPSHSRSHPQHHKQEQATVYPTEPGTCVIQAFVYKIQPNDASAESEPCKSYPCMAEVVITQCRSCGYAVHQKPAVGDTLKVKFIHSLSSSIEYTKVYPTKVMLPGLKTDQLFEAQIKIKLLPGNELSYQIAEYELLR